MKYTNKASICICVYMYDCLICSYGYILNLCQVVEETIRMANIAAVLFRQATKDVDYKGFTISIKCFIYLYMILLFTCFTTFNYMQGIGYQRDGM